MHIFLSYSSRYRDQADDICCRLQALGHEVFFDREDLPAGVSFDDLIREAIESADMFIFLVAPESVAAGRYTRTELKLAQRKWPTPQWHVLPVMVADTPFDDIPAYLRALTLLQPEGNLTAEVVMEVEDRVRAHGTKSAPKHAPAKSTDEGGYHSISLRFAGDIARGFSVDLGPDTPGTTPPGIALDPAALEQALWANAAPIAGTARRGSHSADANRLPSGANARKIGQALYDALFDDVRGETLRARLRALDPQRGDGLRFVIDTTDAPALARLPWEFIYSPQEDDFLFADRLKPIVRWLQVDAPPPSLAVKPPLRMLMAVAAPADRPELSVGAELAHLDRALDELAEAGVLQTIRLEHASLERLDAAMLEHQPHVLHFIGHGDFVDEDGVLLLESDRPGAGAEPIAGRQLAVLLRNYRAHLRLVFLNSCMGATSGRSDPFGGVAQSLIRRGIPAVIAMQFPIPDEAAVALARHFYRYLAAGQPVDAALSSARAFLYARGYPVEWGAPALHMRAPDGRLFDLEPADRPGAGAQAPEITAHTPGSADTPPPQAAPAAETASPRGRRSPWIAAVMLLVVTGLGFAAWHFMSPTAPDLAKEPPPPAVEPVPAPVEPVPGPVEPVPAPIEPAPEPEPIQPPMVVVESTPEARIDAAIAQLNAGRFAEGRTALEAMLEEADPETVEVLESTRLDPALEALDTATRAATEAGLTDEADALRELFGRLLPEEPMVIMPEPVIEPDDPLDAAVAALETGDVSAALALIETTVDPAGLDEDARDRLIGPLVRAGLSASEQGRWSEAERIVMLLEQLAPESGWAQIIGSNAVAPAAGAEMPSALYTVRPGDTLWGLARRFLDSGRAWPELMAYHNHQAIIGRGGIPIQRPDLLIVGQRLNLPIQSDNFGRPVYHYRVMPGDTLSGIARRIYGDARLWPELMRANEATINHPDRLFVGQTLTVPLGPVHH